MALALITINMTLLHRTVVASDDQQSSQDVVLVAPVEPIPVAVDRDGTSEILGIDVVAEDARPILLKQFLEKHDSPMAPHADFLVSEADRFGIDFRLVVAIAMCESNLGKKMPAGSYNAWGIAVYTGQNSGATFAGWPEAITWVSQYMKEHYYDRGLVDLKDIGAIYAPPSVETEYSWTRCVETFQNSIL